ncbi:MAG: SIS domain-containing protein [Solirubrobacterales bacterium]|nr:SIS domain-containing protein [Solirubrobacterales bacterium]
MKDHIRGYLDRLEAALATIPAEQVEDLSARLYRSYQDGKQVFVLGNGGSASTASHMAADLAKNTIGPNMRRFRIISLNDNIPLLTALSNDMGYHRVFAEQLVNLIRPGDVLVVISGSGNSPNVLRAIEYARGQCAQIVGLLGFSGGRAAELCDTAIIVSSDDYGVVEDAHLILNHILVEYFRDRLLREVPTYA